MLAMSQLVWSSPKQLISAITVLERAESLYNIEMGSSAQTEVRRAEKLFMNIDTKGLNQFQKELREKSLKRIAQLKNNGRESLNSCDYFELQREKNEELILNHLDQKHRFLSISKLEEMKRKVDEKKHCAQYSAWDERVFELSSKVFETFQTNPEKASASSNKNSNQA